MTVKRGYCDAILAAKIYPMVPVIRLKFEIFLPPAPFNGPERSENFPPILLLAAIFYVDDRDVLDDRQKTDEMAGAQLNFENGFRIVYSDCSGSEQDDFRYSNLSLKIRIG